MAVAAAGYNAFHELIAFGVPTPVRADAAQHRRSGRARRAGRPRPASGWRSTAPATPRSATELRRLCDPARAARARRGREPRLPRQRRRRRGGVVSGMAAGSARPRVRRPRRASTAGCGSPSHRSGRRLPLVARAGRARPPLLPRAPPPRLARVWRSGPAGGARERVAQAIGALDPSRACLVLTDSFEFAMLRGARRRLRAPAAARRAPDDRQAGACALRAALLLGGQWPLRRIGRRAARSPGSARAREGRGAPMTDRSASGTLGDAYGGSRPDHRVPSRRGGGAGRDPPRCASRHERARTPRCPI